MILKNKIQSYILLRKYLKVTQIFIQLSHKWPSKSIRSTFTSFYKEKNHVFIPSSSVIPWSDHSLEFTNAGMNQVNEDILLYFYTIFILD